MILVDSLAIVKLSESEVRDDDFLKTRFSEQDVFRFDVSMYDSFGMHNREGIQKLIDALNGVFFREGGSGKNVIQISEGE